MRRLMTAEQHKTNSTVGQSLQALGGGADVAAHGGTHIALQQGFGAAGAVDQPAGTRQRRHSTALGLLGQPLKLGWQALGCAPGREMGLEIGELWQLRTQLHGSEAATQQRVQQRPCGD